MNSIFAEFKNMVESSDALNNIFDACKVEQFLLDEIVPESGNSNCFAGEMIRAVNKLEYRAYNDGDYFFLDYGIETCGEAAAFIYNCDTRYGKNSTSESIHNLMEEIAVGEFSNEDFYDCYRDYFLKELIKYIIKYIYEIGEVAFEEKEFEMLNEPMDKIRHLFIDSYNNDDDDDDDYDDGDYQYDDSFGWVPTD